MKSIFNKLLVHSTTRYTKLDVNNIIWKIHDNIECKIDTLVLDSIDLEYIEKAIDEAFPS